MSERSRAKARVAVPAPMAAPRKEADPYPWLLAALVFGLTLLAYLPSLHGAVLWDDTGHVTKAELRSLMGLAQIWFELGASQQYYPMLHTAFWVEHRLWGDATLGYHLVNIFLHATSACLLAVVLKMIWAGDNADKTMARCATQASWVAAFLFALHPVCVESVAWISEQKNTLSGVFYLLAALAFLRFHGGTGKPGAKRGGWGLYALATLLFICALLSKTVTATLPAALLVVLWWRQGRLAVRQDILPLVPWFAFGGLAGLGTAWIERNVIGAGGGAFELSFVQRCLVAGRAIWFYLGKLLWPADLIFVYPHWTISAAVWWQYLFPAGILALLGLLWLPMRRRGSSRATRAPLAGFLFFSGTLFPVLGFFNIYPFRFSYVADHFQYLASLGIIVLAAAGWGVWARRTAAAGSLAGNRRPWLAAALVVAVCGVLSARQSRMYENEGTLFRATLQRNPGSWMAENNLGTYLARPEKFGAEAFAHFRSALRLNPDYSQGHNNLGSELLKDGKVSEAIAELQLALRLEPTYPDAHNNLGLAYARAGDLRKAEGEFREAIRLKPTYAEAYNDLGITLAETGRTDEALQAFESGIGLKPDSPGLRKNYGVALAQKNRLAEAAEQFEVLVRLTPDDEQAKQALAAIRAHMPR